MSSERDNGMPAMLPVRPQQCNVEELSNLVDPEDVWEEIETVAYMRTKGTSCFHLPMEEFGGDADDDVVFVCRRDVECTDKDPAVKPKAVAGGPTYHPWCNVCLAIYAQNTIPDCE